MLEGILCAHNLIYFSELEISDSRIDRKTSNAHLVKTNIENRRRGSEKTTILRTVAQMTILSVERSFGMVGGGRNSLL